LEGRWIDGVWIAPVDEPVPVPEEPQREPAPNERMDEIEAALIELAGLVAGGE
jgi:hypothetical protein